MQKDLSVRIHECHECGSIKPRDIASAQVICARGLSGVEIASGAEVSGALETVSRQLVIRYWHKGLMTKDTKQLSTRNPDNCIHVEQEITRFQGIREGVGVFDRSHWGRIRVSGADRVRFLHNQSTNDFNSLKVGQSCDTVFVTSTARTIDLATALVTEEAILLLISPNRRQSLMTWLDRYLFPMDKVELEDITDSTACFSLIGNQSTAFLQQLGMTADFPNGTHQLVSIDGIEVRIATGSGLATPGYTLLFEANAAATLWKRFLESDAVALDEQGWEQLRIEDGRPFPDAELTEDYNPLEAGLWQTISFDKGCYIGQETIARLNTYKGVKTQLWGIRLAALAEPGTLVTLNDEKIGTLTSVVATPSGVVGLVYIRTRAGGAGLKVQVGHTTGEVVNVPFLTRGYLVDS